MVVPAYPGHVVLVVIYMPESTKTDYQMRKIHSDGKMNKKTQTFNFYVFSFRADTVAFLILSRNY